MPKLIKKREELKNDKTKKSIPKIGFPDVTESIENNKIKKLKKSQIDSKLSPSRVTLLKTTRIIIKKACIILNNLLKKNALKQTRTHLRVLKH